MIQRLTIKSKGGIFMKRFLSVLLVAVISLSFSTIASAAEISILEAERDESEYVNFKCSISDVEDAQQITTVAREYSASNDDTSAIIYIDQFEPEITDGEFEYSFNVKSNMDDSKVYLLRVGGTGVEKVAQKIIGISGKNVYVAGDVNGDGYINDIDAAIVLRYISGLEELDTSEQLAANVVDSDDINMLDVITILSSDKDK
jgi:hypothetical protein